MDVYEALQAGSKKLLAAARKLEPSNAGEPEERARLLEDVVTHLETQTEVEERHLLPRLAAEHATRAGVETVRDEARQMRATVEQLRNTDPTDVHFQLLAERLSEEAEQRAHDQRALFVAALKVLPAEEARLLGPRVRHDEKELRSRLRPGPPTV